MKPSQTSHDDLARALPAAEAAPAPANEPAPAPAPAWGKRRRVLALVAAVAALLAALGGVHAFLTRGEQTTDDAQIQADVVPLAPRVAGAVIRLHVAEDQAVKKGDLLFEIDPADYAARLRQAEAEVATAQAQAQAADAQAQVVEASAKGGFAGARAAVSSSSAALEGADAQILAARAALRRAEAESTRAAADLQRARQLRAGEAMSQQQLDAAQAGADTADASVAAARAQLAAAEEAKRSAAGRVGEAQGKLDQSMPIAAQIAAARANADLAHARVKSAEAALELAKLQLSYARITAPADGIVSNLTAREGQLVQAGQPLAQLVPVRTYVVANFKETQVGAMRPGQRAEIEIDAYSGRTLEGRVESISGGTGARFSLLPPDNASGNFVKVVERVPVRIAWTKPPPDGLALRAGLSAGVTVHTR
ncbi:MAG: HlyD family secretion protein [Anaeromyxobacteraceae bacterium]